MTVVSIHGFSAESELEDQASITGIYGDLPARIAATGAGTPTTVNVSRWVSLDDGLDLEYLTRALHQHPNKLLEGRFDAIVHSTGVLVIRNWIRRHCTPGQCPIDRIIDLAGASWGSGWAHIGKSQMARWAMGSQRGVQVLNCLEFGSTWIVDLHAHFLQEGHNLFDDYGVMEFCIIGSQVDGMGVLAPTRYGKEDGSDGVVRVASGNLNHHYVKVGLNPEQRLQTIAWKEAREYAASFHEGKVSDKVSDAAFAGHSFDAPYYRTLADFQPVEAGGVAPADMGEGARSRPRIPFAVVYNCAHSGKEMGVVSGRDVLDSILEQLIVPALKCPRQPGDYEQVAQAYDQVTLATRQRATRRTHRSGVLGALQELLVDAGAVNFSPVAQYDPHAQVIVRVEDQNGQPVKHCDIHFNSFGGGQSPAVMIGDLMQDHHHNSTHPGAHTFYLRCGSWVGGQWTDRLQAVQGLDLEVSVVDPVTRRVLYVPLRMRLRPEMLKRFICPDRTTVIDVQLMRLPDDRTFVLA